MRAWPGSELLAAGGRCLRLARQLLALPLARLRFDTRLNPPAIAATYRNFTRPHPKYKVFARKGLGVALIDVAATPTAEAYLARVQQQRQLAALARKARTRGYRFVEIDRNDYRDDIHAINTSSPQRQGQPMDPAYLRPVEHYEAEAHFRYFGMVDPDGRLMAYCNLGLYGNFAAFSQLLGHRNNDGVMHAMVIEAVCLLLRTGGLDYIMYDTYFGARPGLRQFKTMLGFQPYRVKYRLR